MSAARLAHLARVALFSLAALGAGGASAALPDEAPAWSDEPPALARLLESGFKAENLRQPGVAAAHYCAAARDGSVEGQYRLGRLYLMGQGVARDNQIATTLLSIAAQRGHEKARSLVVPMAAGESLPDCLVTGTPPALLAAAASEEAVPQEVVDRFVKALPADKRRLAQLVQKLAPRFQVDPRLALAIVRTESNFDPSARSPKNALGLMQLIPDTAERFGVRDALDPEQNVRGGLAYLRWLLSQFKGDVALAAAAYNAGEGNVMRYKGVPPFAETQEYVRRILAFYRAPRHTETLRG
ncbi:transglycosylase SLT domain-containing protein [Zoogloea sp.]|uniref:transglycosylase SLT domain-containing protein n=1 Tax=Zoogloea sp. TaxID=49181 RepID=UPI0035AE1D86